MSSFAVSVGVPRALLCAAPYRAPWTPFKGLPVGSPPFSPPVPPCSPGLAPFYFCGFAFASFAWRWLRRPFPLALLLLCLLASRCTLAPVGGRRPGPPLARCIFLSFGVFAGVLSLHVVSDPYLLGLCPFVSNVLGCAGPPPQLTPHFRVCSPSSPFRRTRPTLRAPSLFCQGVTVPARQRLVLPFCLGVLFLARFLTVLVPFPTLRRPSAFQLPSSPAHFFFSLPCALCVPPVSSSVSSVFLPLFLVRFSTAPTRTPSRSPFQPRRSLPPLRFAGSFAAAEGCLCPPLLLI